MNINLLGIKTSSASGALFRSEWRAHRTGVLLFIGEVFFTWVLILGGVALLITGMALMDPALRTPDKVVQVSLGMPYSVLSFRLAMSVLVLAVPATALRILHHFYYAAELEYRCMADYLDSLRPAVRLHMKKCQQRCGAAGQCDYSADAVRGGVTVTPLSPSDDEVNKS
ncbi:hypothetical protein [Serratia odorifera]|uniref:Uncharacterized protein n=2 Tax=Serratia odorifera TaxID=618 RepID=D4EA48_SEROD|nr:hypothetical protein [Serratia odorifera]EFE93316.1 hypothetical protein HMPREF0758_5048 [Serratia odorifera DSM 4582]PNK88309.1 hypothetical protein CEQ31_000545 [Serratia odorifera]RII73957.1 hypothetical protein DX901_00940 [Serratia odorifera]VDZ51166.1 Uncharacterised protein [Serratia odorifera]